MAKCTRCGSETELYDANIPICVKCSEDWDAQSKLPQTEQQIRAVLVKEIVEATARVSLANEAFSAVMSQFPSGLPHPDGTQRIHNASRELSAARSEMMKAHTRLNDFIEHGILPEDPKRKV